MNAILRVTACLLLSAVAALSHAQSLPCPAVPDVVTITLGQPFSFNVTTNDLGAPPTCPVRLVGAPECLNIEPNGNLVLQRPDDPTCCGVFNLVYMYEPCIGGGGICSATVQVTVLCPKPDCFLVNLEDYVGSSSPIGGPPSCAYACENSDATYFVPFISGNTYAWSVLGGTFAPGANAAEINITWGAQGTGSVSVTITDANNQSTVLTICVQVLQSPVAAFSASDSTLCLDSPVSFGNLSSGASSYFWDFGDGNYSALVSPMWTYAGPGTYIVTLYATRANYDPQGNPLCCCTDSTTMTIVVDSIPGPSIFCISTLCANNSATYGTDATNCSNYTWTVLDALGNPVVFIGQGTPNINVTWGNGPVGTIILNVTGCDSTYCNDPTIVTVPIIPNTTIINGPVVVCENATETYTVPKWMSTLYTWSVSGGSIVSGQGTNTVVIQWGTAPGPGIINLNWVSSFLSGLPGQNPEDCEGSATLLVNIKPEFTVSGPSPAVVCVNSTSSYFASPVDNYTWTISPAAAFSGQGTSSISVNWTLPGNYTVTAVPNDTTAYCNDQVTLNITVVLLAPPDSIGGETDICPGQTSTYFGYSSASGVAFNWTVTGGTPATFTGDPITVTWNPNGPYGLTLTQSQLNAPFCTSDPIGLAITPKVVNGPLSISGTGSCTNATGSYVLNPAQHPSAVITWAISPAGAGSVVSGQGSNSITVQWNNTSGPVILTASVELCGNSVPVAQLLNLTAAIPPTITQVGILCPGQPATLNAGPGYASYLWSTTDITQTTLITSGGSYNVQVTDANGCPAFATYNAVALPGPIASISSAGPFQFCIDPPGGGSMTMTALTNPNYTYVWFCNSLPQVTPPNQNTFTHTNTNVVASFVYWVVVTDISTGCSNTSNAINVLQYEDCDATGPECISQPHTVNFTVTNQTPYCNVVDFAASFTGPVTLGGWNFGDPFGNVNSGTLSNAQHTYAQAGVYNVILSYSVAQAPPDTGFCLGSVNLPVSIPLAADFEFSDSCQTIFFTDFSTSLTNNIIGWSWTFGDAGTSSLQNPSHTYATGGTYWVTLTVVDANGCQAIYGDSVSVPGPPPALISIAPNPACVGDPVSFTGTGSNILSWFWTFGDATDNGAQNPQHTYLSQGTFPVTLTVVSAQGCTNTVLSSVVINPAVPDDTISYAPSLTICQGETTTLFAPAGTYTYLWSTGATTSSITTGVAGPYSLIITDPNGCDLELDPVTVVVIPKPIAVISGNPYICDNGCVTLNATQGFGFSYQWLDNLGNPLAADTFQMLTVCDSNLLAGYSVVVTNANGCSDTSAVVTVAVAVSPSFTVSVAGDSCAGSPNVLTVVAVQPGVVYSWSNGGNGPSITVQQPGTYTAFGTDTATGCSNSASAVIHPLPDLCIVPAGCYEVCNPDTICGPNGLAAYQWNLNGLPIPGETNQCLVVTADGVYTLTGTTSFGCTLTSDDLELEVIPCESEPVLCDLVDVEAIPTSSSEDSCCWSLSLSNNLPNYFIGIRLDALGGVSLGYNGSNAGWFNIGSSVSSVDLLEPGLGFVPTGAYTGVLNDVADFCLSGYSSSPQQVVVSWLIPGPPPLGYLVECTDTLEFNCKSEGCVVIVYDTIYCDEDSIKYDFYIENTFGMDVSSIRLNVDPALDVTLSQTVFNFAPVPTFATFGPFHVVVSGPDAVFGNSLAFTITAHNAPILDTVEQTFCCTDTVVIEVPFPDCDPCEDVSVSAVKVEGDCCYKITLSNNFAANYFSGIRTTIITPGATFGSITGAFPLGWVYVPSAPNNIKWKRVPIGSSVPLGNVQLPVICLGGSYPATVQIVVKWLVPGSEGDSIVCCDTLELICNPTLPDCAALLNPEITCDPMGQYVFSFQVVNNSGVTIDQVAFTGVTPVGVNLAPVSVTLAQGDTSAVLSTIISGPGAVAGATVCFALTLHDLGPGGYDFVCCTTDSIFCFTLPDCSSDPCENDLILDDAFEAVGSGPVVLDVLANDDCAVGDFLIPSLVTILIPPSNGTITNINPSTGAITYVPNPGFDGQDCFTYQVCCEVPAVGGLVCCPAQVCLNVIADPIVCDPSDAPDNLQSTILPTQVLLTWNAVPLSVACQVQGQRLIPPGPTPVQNIIGFEVSSTTVPLALAGAGTTWRWRVRCACSINPRIVTPYSVWDTFSIPIARMAEKLPELLVFPNPATDQLNLEFREFGEAMVDVQIVDVQGRILMMQSVAISLEQQVLSLDISRLPAGIYTVNAHSTDSQLGTRFVKIE